MIRRLLARLRRRPVPSTTGDGGVTTSTLFAHALAVHLDATTADFDAGVTRAILYADPGGWWRGRPIEDTVHPELLGAGRLGGHGGAGGHGFTIVWDTLGEFTFRPEHDTGIYDCLRACDRYCDRHPGGLAGFIRDDLEEAFQRRLWSER